jgi:tetratricopeptide (TPR) repeat protein
LIFCLKIIAIHRSCSTDNNLCCSLTHRFEQSGDTLWLEKAIEVYEKLLEASDNEANSFIYHRNSGDVLTRRFKIFCNIGDINLAVLRLEKALELTPDDHPDRSTCLYTLAQSLTVRFSASGDACDLEAAILRLSEAATWRSGSPGNRFLAARTWVDISKKTKHNL